MRKLLLLITIFTFTQCVGQEYYSKVKKDNWRINSYLWSDTEVPWAWRDSYKRVKELVEIKDAKIDHVDEFASSGQTPFLNASGAIKCLREKDQRRSGEIDSMELEAVKIVKYLAKNGANIHARTSGNNLNALHLAANGGREKMIPVLVNLGLDINSRNGDPDYGGTVL